MNKNKTKRKRKRNQKEGKREKKKDWKKADSSMILRDLRHGQKVWHCRFVIAHHTTQTLIQHIQRGSNPHGKKKREEKNFLFQFHVFFLIFFERACVFVFVCVRGAYLLHIFDYRCRCRCHCCYCCYFGRGICGQTKHINWKINDRQTKSRILCGFDKW